MKSSFKSLTNRPKQKPAVQPGVIAVCASDQGRWTRFWPHIMQIIQDTGSKLFVKESGQLAKSRNDCVEYALQQGAPWIWFMDDDHMPETPTLLRLLAHNVDVVGPIYGLRQFPFDPTARELDQPRAPDREILDLPRSGEPGLKEVLGTGTAGLLIRRRVLEALERPWFTLGHLHPELMSEDFSFCDKARAAGFKIWVDTSTPLPHIGTMNSWFQYIDGKWHIMLDLGRGHVKSFAYNYRRTKKEEDAT